MQGVGCRVWGVGYHSHVRGGVRPRREEGRGVGVDLVERKGGEGQLVGPEAVDRQVCLGFGLSVQCRMHGV